MVSNVQQTVHILTGAQQSAPVTRTYTEWKVFLKFLRMSERIRTKERIAEGRRLRISVLPILEWGHHLTHYERGPTDGALDYTLIVPVSLPLA